MIRFYGLDREFGTMSESRTSEAQVSVFAIGQFGGGAGSGGRDANHQRRSCTGRVADDTKFDYFLSGGLALAVGSWVLSTVLSTGTVLGLFVMSCPLL